MIWQREPNFPAHPYQNSREACKISKVRNKECKAVITLRSGKGCKGPTQPMIEDKGTKENVSTLEADMEMERECERLEEINS